MNIIFKKIWRKWQYSVTGLFTAIKEEKSLWSYFGIYIVLIGFGIWVKLNFIEWAIVIITIFLTLSIEVINTALEAAVDAMSFQYNIKVKKIKDIAAGATLVITTGATIAWLLIFIPKFMEVFA